MDIHDLSPPFPCLEGYKCRLKIMGPLWSLLLCCSVAKSWPTLCHSIDCSRAGSTVLQYYQVFLRFMSIESVMLSNHLILSHPFLLLLSVFPSIGVFSNMLALCIRRPKYWSFSFSFIISPSNEYSGLISFTIDWFDLLAVQEALSLLQHHSLKASILWHSTFFMVQLSHQYMTSRKTIDLDLCHQSDVSAF